MIDRIDLEKCAGCPFNPECHAWAFLTGVVCCNMTGESYEGDEIENPEVLSGWNMADAYRFVQGG